MFLLHILFTSLSNPLWVFLSLTEQFRPRLYDLQFEEWRLPDRVLFKKKAQNIPVQHLTLYDLEEPGCWHGGAGGDGGRGRSDGIPSALYRVCLSTEFSCSPRGCPGIEGMEEKKGERGEERKTGKNNRRYFLLVLHSLSANQSHLALQNVFLSPNRREVFSRVERQLLPSVDGGGDISWSAWKLNWPVGDGGVERRLRGKEERARIKTCTMVEGWWKKQGRWRREKEMEKEKKVKRRSCVLLESKYSEQVTPLLLSFELT